MRGTTLGHLQKTEELERYCKLWPFSRLTPNRKMLSSETSHLERSPSANRKNHVLCIAYKPTSQRYQYLVIDYESVCAIASKNEPSSHIPWDFWKHKTTQIAYYPEFSSPPMLVGPRAFSVSRDGGDGPMVWSFDFTPGACHFIGQLGPSSKVMPLHVIRWTSLTDEFVRNEEPNFAPCAYVPSIKEIGPSVLSSPNSISFSSCGFPAG